MTQKIVREYEEPQLDQQLQQIFKNCRYMNTYNENKYKEKENKEKEEKEKKYKSLFKHAIKGLKKDFKANQSTFQYVGMWGSTLYNGVANVLIFFLNMLSQLFVAINTFFKYCQSLYTRFEYCCGRIRVGRSDDWFFSHQNPYKKIDEMMWYCSLLTIPFWLMLICHSLAPRLLTKYCQNINNNDCVNDKDLDYYTASRIVFSLAFIISVGIGVLIYNCLPHFKVVAKTTTILGLIVSTIYYIPYIFIYYYQIV